MKRHYCPICLKPKPIAWCDKHGSFYAVDNRTAKTAPGTLTRAEQAKLIQEHRALAGPRKPRKYRPD